MQVIVKLFCLPNAGASAAVYAGWRRVLPQWIDVRPVELPGRGSRFDEPLIEMFDGLVDRLAAEWRKVDGPYALFGHSMGALLAFALTHRLGARGPCALLVSGSPSPQLRDPQRVTEPLSDAVLMRQLRALGGTPAELLANDELMHMMLPVMRADFRVCNSYRHATQGRLACPIHAFGGRDDRVVGDAVAGWNEETAAGFTLDWFDGGHFFLQANAQPMLARIAELLLRYSMAVSNKEAACLP
jgi:surfactin synthase thioesterase subunit